MRGFRLEELFFFWQGNYDPTRTKVLQFTINPFSTAQRKLTAELDQLREDNRRLTKRIQIMEESKEESRGLAAVDNLSARVDDELHASSGKEVEGAVIAFIIMPKYSSVYVPYIQET